MNLVKVTLELILARKAELVEFAAKDWAFEVLRLDAMLGRGVAFEVVPAFSDEFAAGLTASPLSRLAVVVFTAPPPFMVEKLLQLVKIRIESRIIFCCPLTASNAAAEYP